MAATSASPGAKIGATIWNVLQLLLTFVVFLVCLRAAPMGIQIFVIVYGTLFASRLIFPAKLFISPLTPKRLVFLALLFISAMLWLTYFAHQILFETPTFQDEIERGSMLATLLAGDPTTQWLWCILFALITTIIGFAVVLLPVSIIGAIAFLSGYEERHKQQVTSWQMTLSILSIILGVNKRVEVITGGKSWLTQKPLLGLARFGSEGLAIVGKGYAVVLERRDRVRVVGEGVIPLGSFERATLIVPLTSQNVMVTAENVLTEDGVFIDKFELRFHFGADPGSKKPRSSSDFVYDEDNIFKLWKAIGDDFSRTHIAVSKIVEYELRDVIGKRKLDNVCTVQRQPGGSPTVFPREEIAEELKLRAANRLKFVGLSASRVEIGKIVLPKQAQERLMEKWLADWAIRLAESEKEILITRGEADAAVINLREIARAQAQTRMIIAITEGFRQATIHGVAVPQLIALRFIEALEKMAADPATKILLPTDVLQTLQAMRGMLGGQGPQILPPPPGDGES